MRYMDAVADLFCFEPEDDLTKKSIAEFMKKSYPGDYEVEVTFIDGGFRITQKFRDPVEQTMFMLRWA